MSKKTFKNNPALQFITAQPETTPTPQVELPQAEEITTPTPQVELKGLFVIPKKEVETKSRRVQLVFKPSLYEKVSTEAQALGFSTNEFIAKLIETYFESKGE